MSPDRNRRLPVQVGHPIDSGRSPNPDAIVELCAFRVGSEEYVVDIRRIREVVNPLEIHPVPKGPEFLEGVADLRGEVIPVVDVRRRLGVPRTAPTRKAKFLVTQIGRRAVALLVDAVCDVVRISRSSIRPAPGLAHPQGPRLFLGVCGGGIDSTAATSTRHSGRSGAAGKLRLLLNVRALLEPGVVEQVTAATRARAGDDQGSTQEGGGS